jgi:hypothetical protein
VANQLYNKFKADGQELAKGDIAIVDVSARIATPSCRRLLTKRLYREPKLITINLAGLLSALVCDLRRSLPVPWSRSLRLILRTSLPMPRR